MSGLEELTGKMVAVLIDVYKGRPLAPRKLRTVDALVRRGLVSYDGLSTAGIAAVTKEGIAALKGYHVHSYLCFADGDGMYVCNKVEGEREAAS